MSITDHEGTVVHCPQCGQAMEQGWLAVYEPIIITRVVWQPAKPGYVRFRAPPGSETVIQPRAGGGGCPAASICRACKLTLFSYDPHNAI